MTFTRQLGRSGLEVSAMGIGCWAIGGPFWWDGNPVGWGQVDDKQSIRGLQRALDLGVNFFDTADVYGCGHSERILAKAFRGKRDRVIIATKFGLVFEEDTRRMTRFEASPKYIRQACEASLRRLDTDYIDLYQFHINDHPPEKADVVRDTLEELVAEGKIRVYGWSTDFSERARIFAEGRNCCAFQHQENMFLDNVEMISLCEEREIASINRGPLAMGLLTGKFIESSELPEDDIRHDWEFGKGELRDQLKKLEEIREVLTSDGRTLAQAALGWLWARSESTIPIPGFKTIQQIEENIQGLEFGPLSEEQMGAIEGLIDRSSEAFSWQRESDD
jgi:aryl-alcohol dehydrogenase-like predicted oxidoreductase